MLGASPDGHVGNKGANCLAIGVARSQFLGPKPFFSIPAGFIRQMIQSWSEREFADKLKEFSVLKHVSYFCWKIVRYGY